MPYVGKKPADIIATAVDATTGTFSGNVTAAGTLGVTGETTLATHLNMGDGDIIKLGASADLTIQHDGSNSYIKDEGTGNLYIRTDGTTMNLQAGSDNAVKITKDAQVELYHDNSKKIETTSSGVTVTGGVTTTTASSIEGGVVFNESSADVDFRVESNSNANTFFVDGGGDRVYIGDNVSRNLFASKLQIEGDGTSGMSIHRATADSGPPYFNLSSSRGTAAGDATVVQNGDGVGTIYFSGADGTDRFSGAAYISCHIDGTPGSNDMPGRLIFATTTDGSSSPTERLRINSSGYIYVNTGGAEPSASQVGVRITGTQGASFWNSANSGTGGYNHLNFYNDNGLVGNIYTNGSGTVFNTGSDYRLKENVVTDWDATTRLKQLKPSRFNFIPDANTTLDGFLAHEVQSVVPEAITGTKDETEDITDIVLNADGTIFNTDVSKEKWTAGKLSTTDELGNTVDPIYASDTTWIASKTVPKYQGIDQSKLVPLLTKALQEQQATIEALTARIVTLENS